MLEQESELLEKLNSLSLRELDILIAKYFYNLEVKFERVQSKNSNNIRYYYIKPNKRRYFNNTLKIIQKPLPRYCSDIRDCYSLLKDANEKFGKISISLDKDKAEVILCGFKIVDRLQVAIVKSVLYQTLRGKLRIEESLQNYQQA